MLKNELKVIFGNYNIGNKYFKGLYMIGKHQEIRVWIWKFWYSNGK